MLWGVKPLAFGPRMVRIVSIVCGFFAIILGFQIARLLAPNEPLVAICAAGIAALTPSHIAILSAVNNDALLEVGFQPVAAIDAASAAKRLHAMAGGLDWLRYRNRLFDKSNGDFAVSYPAFRFILILSRRRSAENANA